jgi:hypothetical protein
MMQRSGEGDRFFANLNDLEREDDSSSKEADIIEPNSD